MSLDPVVEQRVNEVVQEFVDDGKMFTAFEVSLEVKARGVRQRHRDMRAFVHQSIHQQAGQNYTRTLRDVGAPVQAWVYHRLRDNPSSYTPLDRSGHDAIPAKPASDRRGAAPRNPQPLKAAKSITPATASDGAYGTDQDGCLTVPPELLESLGIKAGEAAEIAFDSDNQEIRIWRPSIVSTMNSDLTLNANDAGKLEFTEDNLKQADLDGMQCYRIISRGNLITIRDFS